MTSEEEAREAQQLINEINRVAQQLRYEAQRQAELIAELKFLFTAVPVLIKGAADLGVVVHEDLGSLADRVKREEVSADELFGLLRDLSEQYFSYKNLSTATKNVTQFTDQYYTEFAYYNELRRISLGYVIGLDAHIISSETARKKVEKAYLQNTEYWLTYCITATMLWASGEREAAERSLSKALSLESAKSSLFFLLVMLRFARLDAAVKWYSYYLDKADSNNLGQDWQYLLQAYLSGAFGGSRELEARVHGRLAEMMAQIQVTNISYDKEIADRAQSYANAKPHVTEFPFFLLKEHSGSFEELRSLLSLAERNALFAEEYSRIAAEEIVTAQDLATRIEDTLYNVIESMDAAEEKVYKRIKYNELIVAAKGDVAVAQAAYDERYPEQGELSFGDLLANWAFSEGDVRVSPAVRRFSISLLKERIADGFKRYVEDYRKVEKERYEITMGTWSFSCTEDEADLAVGKFEEHFGKTKWKDFLKDTYILVWAGAVVLALVILLVMAIGGSFSGAAVVVAVLLGISGAFLLWRRIVDLDAVLAHQKRVSMETIRKTIAELGEWRKAYKAADAEYGDLENAFGLFE